MSRLPASLALAAALAVSGGVASALAQGSPHHGPHRATQVQAAPGQVPPTAEQMQQMMQMMGNHSPCVSNVFDRKGRDVSPQVLPLRLIIIIRKMVLIVILLP